MDDRGGAPMDDHGGAPMDDHGGQSGEPEEGPFSGLRNPAAAIRGVGAGTLVLESIVLLLAIQPIRIVAPATPGWALGVIAALAGACLLMTGTLRREWGWKAALALQVAVIATGFFQYALFILGGVFLAIWLYVLRVRAALARPAQFDH
jgi:hypothetical protein